MTLRIAAVAVLAALLATCAGEDLARAHVDGVQAERLEAVPAGTDASARRF
jgi:hypothetical protein